MSAVFSPELKAPQRMPEIDPEKPAMAGMLKILCLTHQKQTAAFPPPAGLACRKTSVPAADGAQIPCFVVEPEGREEPLPGVLMIHGGGFYLPLQVSALNLAAEYARDLGARVFLPEYRLVPQAKAPKQLEDCLAVWNLLSDGGEVSGVDFARLLVMGDSAGAALAAGLCIRLRDAGRRLPRGQLLIYPVLDDRQDRYASYTRCADAPWTAKATAAMWNAYLKGLDGMPDPALVPGRCGDLHGLPPAYVEPQEIDVLCDEAVVYADALRRAGVPAELNLIRGSYHCFDSDLRSPLVRRVIAERIRAAKEMLEF